MSEEELGQAFIEHFEALRAGTGDVHATDMEVQQMCLVPSAPHILTVIATQNSDEIMRRYSLISLKYALKGLIGPDFNPVSLVQTLLEGLSNEPDFTNRNYYAYLIRILTNNEETIALSNQFAQMALESDNQLQIHTAVILCNELIQEGVNNSDEYAQFLYQLAAASFKFNDPPLALDTINLIFNYANTHGLDTNEHLEGIWTLAISLMPSLLENPKKFFTLSQLLGNCINDMAPFVNLEPLIPPYMELLNQDGLDIDISGGVVYVIDAAIRYFPTMISDQNLVAPILQRYIALALASYDSETPSDDYDTEIMANICKEYRDNPAFVQAVWDAISGISSTEEGKYVSMLLLTYLFTPSVDFFYDNMDDVVDLIADSLTVQSIATYEAAIKCFAKFLSKFPEASDYTEVFVPILLENIKARVSIPTLDALADLFHYSSCTDPFFEEVYQLLGALLTQAPPEFHTAILFAITNLASRSEICINDHYQEIMQIMQNLIENPQAELLKVNAIDGIAGLIMTSPENFAPYLESFVPLIMTILQDENSDNYLICPCLNCLGHIINYFAEPIKPLVGNIVPILNALSTRDITPELNSLKEMIAQNAHMDDINDNLETPIFKDALEIPGLAFITYTSLIKNNPELLPECFENVVGIIQQNSKSVISFTQSSICRAIGMIMEIIEETKFEAPPEAKNIIYTSLMLIMTETQNKEVYADALEALATFIQALGLEALGEYAQALPDEIDNILQCNIPILQQEGQDRLQEIEPNHTIKLPSDFYQPLSFLFFAIFSKLGPENIQGFIDKVMPALMQYTESSSNDEKAFALDILLNYATTYEIQDPAFLETIYNLAIACASTNRVSGFYAIKALANKMPDLLKANGAQILQLFGQVFESGKNKGAKNSLQVTVSSLAAFGAFAQNVMGDEFPIEQCGHVAVSLIQPGEDLDETLESYNFLLWLIPKGMPALVNDFIGAFAKLFAQPPKYFDEIAFPKDQLATMKDVFVKLLSMLQNGEAVCAEALKNDPVKLRFLQEALK